MIKRKDGTETITVCGDAVSTLNEFWCWAYSDLISNTERGVFAEYLVSMALNGNTDVRRNWESYDILTAEGIAVEVKSSAYLQSWKQQRLSRISFDIRKTAKWDSDEGRYGEVRKRQSDVYVFCLLNHKNPETLNPLDTSQWDFYVMNTRIVDSLFKEQKTLSLTSLLKNGVRKCSYANLRQAVLAEFVPSNP